MSRKQKNVPVLPRKTDQSANVPIIQSILANSLATIDALSEDHQYIRAMDHICTDMKNGDMHNEPAIVKYEERFYNAIHGLCEQNNGVSELVKLGSALITAPHSIVQLAFSTWIRASLGCAAFPVSLDMEREIVDAAERSSREIFHKLQISQKQAYEKRKILLDELARLEGELHNLLIAPIEVSSVGVLRHNFMKLIKMPISQAVIWPFIPDELRSETRLAQLFSCVSKLDDSAPDEIMDAFANASEILDCYTQRAEEYSTYYSRTIFAELGNKLTQAIQYYMQASPSARPAHIDILEVKKKYPLSTSGTVIYVTFQLNNCGPGTAQDVLFKVVEIDATTLYSEKKEWYLGTVGETIVEICIPITITAPTNDTVIMTSVTWKNFDHSEECHDFIFDLHQQRTDVDWKGIKFFDPYSLEPVEEESELVGRTDILEELASLAYAKSVGSCYLYGQKRVGKTSVVKTLRNKLEKNNEPICPVVIYLERGEFCGTDPITTIQNLGIKICQKLKECDSKFEHLTLPIFIDTLVPLNSFLEDIGRISPQLRGLFVLDEFDELPIGLYKRTDTGDAFFGSLRSVTNKSSFGLLLVGSENMRHVIHLQGHALNKFQTIELDYFDQQRHWADFQELVRRPVNGILDVEDDAIVILYAATYGNPFFTKLICGRLFKTMVNRRDCHVTRIEMNEAINAALRQDMGINKVQHFWSDGIFESEARHEEISLRRRKILLSLAFVARDSSVIKKENVAITCMAKFGIDETVLDQELADLSTTRKIVKIVDGNIEFMIPFFLRWLVASGINEIISISIDADASLRRSREEEAARIRPEEILELTEKWQGLYKGRQISEDLIRMWLSQFGDTTRQRLVFIILKGLKFYTQMEVRNKVREAHSIVSRHLVHFIEDGKLKRRDILVSYLDGPGKSGSRYAKLYADENNIYYDNVIEMSRLGPYLKNRSNEIEAVVFMDDLIGTGKTASENFERMSQDAQIIACRDKVKMFLLSICGLESGIAELERRIAKLPLQIEVHVCDHLDDRDRVFSGSSKFFDDHQQRDEALALCREVGSTLEKNHPLGYGDSQLAVVFEDTTPNNSLPVLWKKKKSWTALFPRD
jgi:hypothetical protein